MIRKKFLFICICISYLISCTNNDFVESDCYCDCTELENPPEPLALNAPNSSAALSHLSTLNFTIQERSLLPLLTANKPWESAGINYTSVLKVGETWKMWYESFDDHSEGDFDMIPYLCYAESKDGVLWNKPELGITAYNGNYRNNILMRMELPGTQVTYDETADVNFRYKLIYTRPNDVHGNWVYGMSSGDGLDFVKPVLLQKAYSDTQTAILREKDGYRLYSRVWDGPQIGVGRRGIGYSESTTFGGTCFPKPRKILSLDNFGDRDLYNNAITKIADSLYLMFPSVFFHSTSLVIPHLAVSADGFTFALKESSPFLALGGGFDSDAIYVCPGGIQGETKDEFIFYYLGKSIPHSATTNEMKSSFVGGVGRFVVKIH